MKNLTALLLLSIALFLNANAQDNTPYIEVIGETKKLVIPDQIFIKLILDDSELDNSVELTENLLIGKLEEDGLLKKNNLYVLDVSSDLYERWLRRDKKINRKEYELELKDNEEVSKLFQILQELEIYNARITRLDYSKKEALEIELLHNALKNARLKAESLLKDSNQSVGDIKLISEDLQNIISNSSYFRSTSIVVRRALTGSISSVNLANNSLDLNFQELEFEAKIFARFEIVPNSDK